MTRSVALLALAAAVRVLVYSSGFPFFSPVDEHQHIDSVVRYARGEWPAATVATLDERVALWATDFGSFEYLDARPQPPYLRRPGATLDSTLVKRARSAYARVKNTEFDSPPVYYFTAARWLELGAALGLSNLALLYWLRAANALALAALVLGSHQLVKHIHPGDRFLALGVPALLAFAPSDFWFGVTSDVGAALTGALAFAGLAWLQRGGPSLGAGRAALVGGAVAAAFLTKYTNAPYLVLAAGLGASWLRDRDGRRRAIRPIAALGAAALVPIALWFARNLVVIGDLTGTARKVALLEWTPKPPGAWLEHPLLGPAGLAEFAGRLIARFWRGQYTWLGEPMASAWMDVLFVASTALFLGFAVYFARPRRAAADPLRVDVGFERLALLAVVGGASVLAALSLRFEFADWGNPTRSDPFFTHGRLISGVWLPFACVYVRGIQQACAAVASERAGRMAWLVLSLWLAGVTASEVLLRAPAFASPLNAWNIAPRLSQGRTQLLFNRTPVIETRTQAQTPAYFSYPPSATSNRSPWRRSVPQPHDHLAKLGGTAMEDG